MPILDWIGKQAVINHDRARFIDQLARGQVLGAEPRPATRRILLAPTSQEPILSDFVCQLIDGRILVVEYKGHDRYSNEDSIEKRTIGELWAQRSHGHCLSVMTDGPDFEAITRAIRH